MVNQEKRIEYWNYLTTEKAERPKGVTDKRLEKIKSEILADDQFWFQVIERHGAEFMSPVELYAEERRNRADHSRGNFWSMIREKIFSK
jgi:hypothetical protein